MPFVNPRTVHDPATGLSPPAAWGDAVNDSMQWLAGDNSFLQAKPYCRIYHAAPQNVANATATALSFAAERYDIGGMHSTSTNTSRITVPSGAAGVYSIGANVAYASNATGYRLTEIRVNGSTRIALTTIPGMSLDNLVVNLSCDYYLSVGDYVETFATQTSGGILAVVSGSAYSPEMWARWVAAG